MNLIKFNEQDVLEFNDYKYIEQNISDMKGMIVHFPFKNLCYKSFNFFWYLPNQNFNNLNIIVKLLEKITRIETKNGSTFIEGTEVRCDGNYKLNFIDFEKLKYKYTTKKLKPDLELIYLELLL